MLLAKLPAHRLEPASPSLQRQRLAAERVVYHLLLLRLGSHHRLDWLGRVCSDLDRRPRLLELDALFPELHHRIGHLGRVRVARSNCVAVHAVPDGALGLGHLFVGG